MNGLELDYGHTEVTQGLLWLKILGESMKLVGF